MQRDSKVANLFKASDIVMEYLVRRGYDPLQANALVGRHVPRLFERGEHRPLVAANLAIAEIEDDISQQAIS
jgi:hypothetical protein